VEDGEVPAAAAPIAASTLWTRIAAKWTAASDWLAETAVVRTVLRLNQAAQHRVDELEKVPQRWLRYTN
jgi:hypothetical protein